MILPLPHDAIASACAPRLAQLPTAVAARFLSWLVDLADSLPPDDRSAFVEIVRSGQLEPVLRAWWLGRDPIAARARLDGAWRRALIAQQLPFVPLPPIPAPALSHA